MRCMRLHIHEDLQSSAFLPYPRNTFWFIPQNTFFSCNAFFFLLYQGAHHAVKAQLLEIDEESISSQYLKGWNQRTTTGKEKCEWMAEKQPASSRPSGRMQGREGNKRFNVHVHGWCERKKAEKETKRSPRDPLGLQEELCFLLSNQYLASMKVSPWI